MAKTETSGLNRVVSMRQSDPSSHDDTTSTSQQLAIELTLSD
jgi:hypothetical protein